MLYQEHGVWDKFEELAKLALTEKLILQAKKRCHKLNLGYYEFSPQVKKWLDRCHAFRALLRLQTGKKIKNKGNVKRFAQRCGINNPMQYSVGELATMYKECRASTKKLMDESPRMYKSFLSTLL